MDTGLFLKYCIPISIGFSLFGIWCKDSYRKHILHKVFVKERDEHTLNILKMIPESTGDDLETYSHEDPAKYCDTFPLDSNFYRERAEERISDLKWIYPNKNYGCNVIRNPGDIYRTTYYFY